MVQRAKRPRRAGLVSEYVYFLRTYKMWWLAPTIVVIAVFGAFVALTGTKGALLIYALF